MYTMYIYMKNADANAFLNRKIILIYVIASLNIYNTYCIEDCLMTVYLIVLYLNILNFLYILSQIYDHTCLLR